MNKPQGQSFLRTRTKELKHCNVRLKKKNKNKHWVKSTEATLITYFKDFKSNTKLLRNC